MKSRTKHAILVSSCIFTVLVLATARSAVKEPASLESHLNLSLLNHPPVLIDGNAAMDAYCAGNGTDGTSWASAHVIANFYILSASNGTGIEIRNTDRFLFVQYCSITGNSGDVDGIRLINCTYARVVGCNVTSATRGIVLRNCTHAVISESRPSFNAAYGIYMENTNHTEIIKNMLLNNTRYGLYLNKSNNNRIYNNTIRDNGAGCIFLENCGHNSITENNCDTPAVSGYLDGWMLVAIIAGIFLSFAHKIFSRKMRNRPCPAARRNRDL